MKRYVIVIASCIFAFGAGTAAGNISHVLGNGGKHYSFDEQCHRVSFVPPGVSTREGVNVLGQQVRCLVRRPDPFARCVRQLGAVPVPAKGHTHPDGTSDWSNVDKIAAYLQGVNDCAFAHFNN